MDRLASAGVGLYSLSYAGPSHEGEAVTFTLELPAGVYDECTTRYRDMSLQRDDFWFLRVTVAHSDVGTYRLIEMIDWTPMRGMVAEAQLVHVDVKHRSKRTYVANGGEVRLGSAPSPAAMADGKHVAASIRLEIPAEQWSLAENGCAGVIDVDSGLTKQTCECVSTSDLRQSCSSIDGMDCCPHIGTAGDVIERNIEIDAAPCGWMCLPLSSDGEASCASLQR